VKAVQRQPGDNPLDRDDQQATRLMYIAARLDGW
jgi:hypothetical protein